MNQKIKRYAIRFYSNGAITSFQKLDAGQKAKDIVQSRFHETLSHVTVKFEPKFHIILSESKITKNEITLILLWLADKNNMRWFIRELCKKHITEVSYDDLRIGFLA